MPIGGVGNDGVVRFYLANICKFGSSLSERCFLKMILSSLLLCVSLSTSPACSDELLDAICQVESACDPSAVGDNGNAIGAYQIWKSYWKDAVEYDPSIGGTYKDCYNKEYSEKIVKAYFARYATEKRLGRKVTDEDRARIHNGGPNGYKKKATEKYWKKIRKALAGS